MAWERNGADNITNYLYDPADRLLERADPLNRRTRFRYDLASRLTSMSHDLGGTTHDAVFSYNWTIASQLARRQSTNGALSAWPVTARNDSYAVNCLNQYTTVTGRTYTHDDNGNLINNGIRNYAYDVENRLVSVSGSPSMTLSYDPLGRLRQTVANGQTVQFLYEGDRLVAEYNGSTTTVLRRYVHGPGIDEPIVWYEGAGLTTSTRRWLHTDERGSVIAHSVANGTATTYSYGPYGEPGNDNWTGSRFRYTGQIVFPEAKLYHYKARVYDPIDGRFLQTDPIGYEDDVNLYAYVGNDPVNKQDPNGKCGSRVGAVEPRCASMTMTENLRNELRSTNASLQQERQDRPADRSGTVGPQDTEVGRAIGAAGGVASIFEQSELAFIAVLVQAYEGARAEADMPGGADLDVIAVGKFARHGPGLAMGGVATYSFRSKALGGIVATGYEYSPAGPALEVASRDAYVRASNVALDSGGYLLEYWNRFVQVFVDRPRID